MLPKGVLPGLFLPSEGGYFRSSTYLNPNTISREKKTKVQPYEHKKHGLGIQNQQHCTISNYKFRRFWDEERRP